MKKMQMVFAKKNNQPRPSETQTTLALTSKLRSNENKINQNKDDSLRNFIGRIVHLRKSCSACGK